MESAQSNYLYLYDLPKDKISSVRIAEAFKKKGINIGTKKPLIKREILKPFYSAIINFQDPNQFLMAKEQMKYFDIEGCTVRSLPFEKDRRDIKSKDSNLNVYYKPGKDCNLTYQHLEDKFGKYGVVKKCKIPINLDYTPKGFAYVCFDNEQAVQ